MNQLIAAIRTAVDDLTTAFEQNPPQEQGAPLAIADAQASKTALANIRINLDAIEAFAARHP